MFATELMLWLNLRNRKGDTYMRSKNRVIHGMLVVGALLLIFAANMWAAEPETIHSKGIFLRYQFTTPAELFVAPDNSYQESTQNSYSVYVSETPIKGQLTLNFTRSKTVFHFGTNGSWFKNWYLSGSGTIPDTYVTLSVTPNTKRAYFEVDTNALPVIVGSPFFYRYSTTPAGELPLAFEVIALNFDWTNELWKREETHSDIDYDDRIVHQQGWSEYNGADAAGTFFDLVVVPPETGAPLGQIGRTDSFTLTQYK
jgi:hypothetical protein